MSLTKPPSRMIADSTAVGRALLTAADAAAQRTALDVSAVAHTHTASQISDSTAAGRAVLTAADAAAQRTALGVPAIAHTHAAADISDSTAVGRTLLTAANATAQRTALGITAYGASLVDDADAAAALTTLGISSFIQTVLDDTTASAARTTLGLPGVSSTATTGAVTLPTGTTAQQPGSPTAGMLRHNTTNDRLEYWAAGGWWSDVPLPSTYSIASNGYWRDPTSGLILQWGNTTGGTNITFPLAFPTACRAVYGTASNDTQNRTCTIGTVTSTQAMIRLWDTAGAASTNSVRWFAIGN